MVLKAFRSCRARGSHGPELRHAHHLPGRELQVAEGPCGLRRPAAHGGRRRRLRRRAQRGAGGQEVAPGHGALEGDEGDEAAANSMHFNAFQCILL